MKTPLSFPAWAALGAAVLLQACTILPKAEPLDVYLLPATAPASASATQAAPWSLRIARPAAGVHLSGQRIVVVPEDNRVSVYAGAGWSDPAPVLVRNRLLDAFRADGRVAALSSDDKQLQADFELDSDLRAFQSEYRDGRPEAVLRLDARLVHTATRRIVASRSFALHAPATDAAVPAVVQAFGAAADRLAAEVVEWTVREGAAVR
ncbi:MAG: ABC-type transport auxiliary lipoprotein family protein [Thauera sp.]|jgi:cholesterol transport system auxiliary component